MHIGQSALHVDGFPAWLDFSKPPTWNAVGLFHLEERVTRFAVKLRAEICQVVHGLPDEKYPVSGRWKHFYNVASFCLT